MTPPDLLSLLLAHRPADAKEERDRDAIASFVRGGGDLFSRGRYDPGHLTGSAFILDAAGSRWLLVHHRRLGLWLQPGGHGEPGETDPLAVALREAVEETGLAGLRPHPSAPVPFDLDVHRIPARREEPEHLHLDIRYLLVAPAGAAPRASAESRGIGWFPLDPPDLSWDGGLLRAARKTASIAAHWRGGA